MNQGSYTTTQGLPTGSYYVFASAAEYVAEVYDDVTCLGCDPATGTPVPVIVGQTTPDIDFVLARGGRIAGRITDAATGKGFPANAEVWSASGVRLNPDNGATGDFTGGYVTNGVPAGTYYLKTDNWSGYVDKAYGNVVCTKACVPVGTQAVQVTEGAITWGIDFSLDRGASVTGAVTDSAGEPMGGTQGQIFDEAGRFVTHWGSDPQGRYLPYNSLAPGTYYARTRNLSGYLDEVYDARPCLGSCNLGDGTPIVVEATDIGGVDFVLRPVLGSPRLDSVTPPTGPLLGGNTVVLVGANFSTLAQVRFGTTPALAVLVDSDFRIRVQAPAGSGPGAVDVTVENPGGVTATLPAAYTYVADTDPPVLTTHLFVASQTLAGVAPTQTVSATLKWTTDEQATTRIDFGVGSLSQNAVVPGFRSAHTVELTGLTPGATYAFQATSVDVSGNPVVEPLSATLISVPDTTPPVIDSLSHTFTDTTATITWHTNEEATTLVQFDGNVGGTLSLQQRVPGTRQNHAVTLTNLQPRHTYAFRVLSGDASGNGPTTVPAPPSYQTFQTVCEAVPPQILSGPAVSYLSNNLVIIAWTTDELSTSFVNYGVSSLNEQGVMDVSLVTQHVVFLTNLQPGQAYGFQAGSTDACGNSSVTANPFPSTQNVVLGQQRLAQSLRLGVATLAAGTNLATTAATTGFTTPAAADTTGPVVATPVAVAVLGADRVRITVGTDEAASILARYGVAGVNEASAFDPSFSQTPSLFLAGLSADTTYHLELVLTDPKGNPTTVSDLTFRTLAQPDTAAPTITNLVVGSLTQTGAAVSWSTNETAESWVRFGLPGTLSNTASGAGLQTTHAIPLAGLSPGTSYEFEASSRDASGNVVTASGAFQTEDAPPTITSLTSDRAAQGATSNVVVSGAHFAANAQVGFGDGIVVSISAINPAGTQIVLSVAVAGDAALGPRQLTITNPQSGLSATASLTIVDATAPIITITSPASGAELVTPSVTITGTVNENATVTIDGEPVPLGNLSFQKALTLPGPGAHRVDVTAVDASGNQSSSSIDVKYMTLSIRDAAVPEGDVDSRPMQLELVLSTPSAHEITVQHATVGGSATEATDYLGASGTVTIPAGRSSFPLAVAVIGDLVDEDDETFTLTLSNASGAAIVDGQATGTIVDDDDPPAISIGDVAVTEGNTGTAAATLTLSLSRPSGKTVNVRTTTVDGTALAGADYTNASGSVSFAPLTTTQTLTVQVRGDLVQEPEETFFVNLSAPVNATLADAQGQVTIQDDDVGGALTINDVSVVEGNRGTTDAVFTVSLGAPAPHPVTVRYRAGPGTASPHDFAPRFGKLVFRVGQVSHTLTVKVKGDRFDEDDETFFVRLSDPQGAPIARGEGVGTILDDDPPPSLSVTDVRITEANWGARSARFVVSLSAPSERPVAVSYITADGTANAGTDYVATSGVLTFDPGETSQSVRVAVKGDRVKETTQTFFLNLDEPLNATIADGQGVGTIEDHD